MAVMDRPIVLHGSQRALSIILAATRPSCEVRSECPQLLSLDTNELVRWVKGYEEELPLPQFVGFLFLHRRYNHGPSGSLGLI